VLDVLTDSLAFKLQQGGVRPRISGPPRTGKSTICRVIQASIGEANVLGTSFYDLRADFGLENWPGKKVVVFTDASMEGVYLAAKRKIVSLLKTVTGVDPLQVNKKNIKMEPITLGARIVIASNEVAHLPDDSGAINTRFIHWEMKNSFLGREDVDLTEKLLAERSGILNWALTGLDRLRSRGRMIQHESGTDAAAKMADIGSDLRRFVEERCNLGPAHEIKAQRLYDNWQTWCEQNGILYKWTLAHKVRSARLSGPGRPTQLLGIGLAKA
jgi:putative DNA primase/helicase